MSSWPINQRSVPAFFLCGILLSFQACSPGYLIHLGIGEARILAGRVPIEKVLKDPSVPQETKNKLQLIREAKEYAEKEIGLTPSRAYTQYYKVHGPAVAYSLTVSPKLELVAHQWCFPIVGCVPYKGFFSLDLAKNEEEAMDKKGFDTYLRGVPAYSTLGWFRDPVFSTMLSYNEATLAEIIIHEMVHRTTFIPHRVEFDEGIATFVGQEGGLAFLEARFGPKAYPCTWAKNRLEDERVFQEFFMRLKDRLTALYASSLSDQEKLDRKSALFAGASKEYQALVPQFRTEGYNGLLRREWNNALVMSYLTYFQDLSLYEHLFEKLGRNLRRMVEFCKGLAREKNPEERIQQWLASQQGA